MSNLFLNDVFRRPHPAVPIVSCHVDNIDERVSAAFPRPTSRTQVLVIQLATGKSQKSKKVPAKKNGGGKVLLGSLILCNRHRKLASQMDRIAVSLFLDYQMHISGAIDLPPAVKLVKDMAELDVKKLPALFGAQEGNISVQDNALQAWIACQAAVKLSDSMPPTINTRTIDAKHLKVIAITHRHSAQLEMLKPSSQKNDIAPQTLSKAGNLHVASTRFKTRIRFNATLRLETVDKQGGQKTVSARSADVKGRAVALKVQGNVGNDKITSIVTIGKEPLTRSEELKAQILMKLLQSHSKPEGQKAFLDQVFPSLIWFNPSSMPKGKALKPQELLVDFPNRPLNGSQRLAGPPGTGKTTVIAAVVVNLMSVTDGGSIWIAAQSNVAVKNVAEKLAAVEFLDFKIVVSKDFHFDWHEHLYSKIEANVIRSDELPENAYAMERLLKGSRVVLCTLSMITNDKMATLCRVVPVETVMIDEASQIAVGDYIPMLYQFGHTIKKIVFIGDDKQLPPYGHSDIPDLQSIFEMQHLRKRALFLDTQYRMPLPIGQFISKHVYDGRLQSQHAISSKSCCRFVDVGGCEESKGTSWINTKEVSFATMIARRLEKSGKSYRIITPYDPQRALLEKSLKDEKLCWEDKCFNVDSFQGS
ncbi:P-loop containing nucleoside triphosphate hydrolase protein [Mycena floridula]|nr:P-loop containing nucleoside triphosphate hydrolase protein [Mycena floridula]